VNFDDEHDREKLIEDLQIHQEELRVQNKQLQEAQSRLEEVLDQYTHLYDFAPMGYLTLTKDGVIQRVNLTAAAMLGKERGYLLNRHLLGFVAYAHQPIFLTHLRDALDAPLLKSCELEMKRKTDDASFWVRMESIRDDSESEKHYVSSAIIDISEQKAAEKKLREARESLAWEAKINAAVAELSSALISSRSTKEISELILSQAIELTQSKSGYVCHIDPKTGEVICYTTNKKSQDAVRFEKSSPMWQWITENRKTMMNNTRISQIPLPEDHAPITRFLAAPAIMQDRIIGQVCAANPDQDYTLKDAALTEELARLYAISVHRKITEEEKEQLQAQLRQAQKMEAIGTLAGGIAHDFNNILFPIIGYAQMLMDDFPEDSIAWKNTQQILIAADRAKALVRQILTFGRIGESERTPLKPDSLLKEVSKLLRASFPSTIDIRLDIREDCGYVLADPAQIHQILMNLCANAYHAMREKGGILTLRLDRPAPPAGKEGYLRISVSDTGYGITPEVMDRIFDPFFTTKKAGEGTGMGLAVVLGIVKSHGGYITVESTQDKQTTFHIYLPATESVEAESDDNLPACVLSDKHEHILVVDDEPQIAAMLNQLLTSMGYRITAMTDSVQAWEFFRSVPESVNLVITDMTMPDMTGLELAARLKAIRPDIPIILCSGFSESFTEKELKAVGICEFLTKPIIRGDLLRSIRAAIGLKN
jgi:PAS domain S-box-containing protein